MTDDGRLVQHQRIGQFVAVEDLQTPIEWVATDFCDDHIDKRLSGDHFEIEVCVEQLAHCELAHQRAPGHGVHDGT